MAAGDIHRYSRHSGNLILAGHLIPSEDDKWSLGRQGIEFNSLYLDGYGKIDYLEVHALLRLQNKATKTANYTVITTDLILLCDTTGGAFTLTLPAVGGSGQILIIKKIDANANAVTLDGNGGETIDGDATNTEMDAQYDTIMLLAGATEWHIIAKEIA